MIVNYEESKSRNAYLDGDVVFYMDHDIPIKNARQFLKEIEHRAKPDEISIAQQIKKGKVKYADKWIQNGWRLFCYDEKLLKQIGKILTEAAVYIVPFFHSTKIIAATNKAEYVFLEDLLKSGVSLDSAAETFSEYFKLPLWCCEFRKMEGL